MCFGLRCWAIHTFSSSPGCCSLIFSSTARTYCTSARHKGAFFGGFFIVPISALIQHQPEEDKKGSVIGAANWLSFVGIGAASGVYYVATHFVHLTPGGIFFWSALATLGATGYVLWMLPDSLLRLLLWIATNTLYRLDV